MDFYKEFKVKAGKKFSLKNISPQEPKHSWLDRDDLKKRLKENTAKLAQLQYQLYAEKKQSLLIVLQALDAAGKDGTINHVMSAMNPQGCRSQSFKVPTSHEAAHDFLWRVHCVAPANGEVVIFNRSHYEEVLIGRVHGATKGKLLNERFEDINAFERLLNRNNTTIVKFFLHISKDEQLKRFGDRLNEPDKHWKISDSDYNERQYWDEYTKAFEDAISNCSTDYAPWFVIPANSKKFRNLAVSEILVKTLETMNPQIPAPTIDVDEIRKLYHQETIEASAK